MEPTLQCRPVVDLGLSSYGIPSEGIHVSGLEEGYEKDWVRLESQVRKAILTIAKDCLLTGQEQACSGIICFLLVCLVALCQEWPNTQENGC